MVVYGLTLVPLLATGTALPSQGQALKEILPQENAVKETVRKVCVARKSTGPGEARLILWRMPRAW